MMSRVGVYISVIIVVCHSIRLVPNTWELVQRQTVVRSVNEVSSSVIGIILCIILFILSRITPGHSGLTSQLWSQI